MRHEDQENETRGRTFAVSLGRLSAIITILPASMAAGWLLGYYVLDRMLHTFPWGSIAAILLGAVAGFYEIVRILLPERDRNKGLDGKS